MCLLVVSSLALLLRLSAQYRLCSVQGITKFSLLTSRMSYASLASIMASATPAANFRFQNVQASDKYIHSGFFYHPNGADAVIEARLYYGKLASSAQLPPQLRHGFV